MITVLHLLANSAAAGPLNPWGAHTGKGAAVINPYLFGSAEGFAPAVYAFVGPTDRFDVAAGAGAAVGSQFAMGALELMPRYFVADGVGLAGHVLWTPGSGSIAAGPELHAVYAEDRFTFTTNLVWHPTFGQGGAQPGTVAAVFAPEVTLTPGVSTYVEVDPVLDLATGQPDLSFVPGLGFLLNGAATHSMALGVILPVRDLEMSTGGLWYAFAFGG